MSKGYPDFFGYSVFPDYGPAIQEHEADMTAAPTTSLAMELTGKGTLHGARVTLLAAGGIEGASLAIQFDNQDSISENLSTQVVRRPFIATEPWLFQIINYNQLLDYAVVIIKGGVSFRDNLKIHVGHATINTVYVIDLLWSRVL